MTGDHSTPVEFGDHSHEPVPFAIAHIRHVVGAALLGCCTAWLSGMRHCLRRRGGPLHCLRSCAGAARTCQLQTQNAAVSKVLYSTGTSVAHSVAPPATAAAANGRSGEQRDQQQLAAAQRQQYIEQQQVEQDLEQQRQRRRPAVVLGDGVSEFTEIAAAAGALGRFPGSQVMPLVRQFVGLEAVS